MIVGTLSLFVILSTMAVLRIQAAGSDNTSRAAEIAESWWFAGDRTAARGLLQKTGAGNHEGDFFAYSGTVINQGSYQEAWSFYAKKCGAKQTCREGTLLLGEPRDDGGYYTIFQRNDGGRRTTTFASHQRDVTIAVYLHEIEAKAERTTLQLSVVVAQHERSGSPRSNR